MNNILENNHNKIEILDIFCPIFNYLEPKITEQVVNVHYNQHHLKYHKYLQDNKIFTLSEAKATHNIKTINFAYQLIYHNMFWKSISVENYQDQFAQIYPRFREDYLDVAKNVFGSGWVILTKEEDQFKWIFISNADEFDPHKILLIFDFWEHAYYLQFYQNKDHYVQTLIECANFVFYETQLKNFNSNL